MANAKYIKWLYEQLGEWIAQGIISEEQAVKIHSHYGEVNDQPDYNIATIVIGVLGVLLVGGGIILIVAYNWDDLSKVWRTILSFVPVILGLAIFGYAFFKKRHSIAWAEGASTFLMLMLAASIALVSQTYHIWGEPETFLWNWLVLSIPLLYLMNSSVVTIIYLIGIASWTMQVRGSDSVWYWALLAAALPYIILNLRKQIEPIRRNLLGWALALTFIFGWFGTIETGIAEVFYIGSALVFSLFYIAGQLSYHNKNLFIYRPFQTFAVAGAFIFLLILTYDIGNLGAFNPKEILYGRHYTPSAGLVNFIIIMLIGLLWIVGSARIWRKEKAPGYFALLLPLVFLIYLIIERQSGEDATKQVILANLYLFAWGVAYLREGILERRMSLVNLGMLFILILATARFFDTKWDFIIKGVAFIILGSGFLIANWLLSKRLKTL